MTFDARTTAAVGAALAGLRTQLGRATRRLAKACCADGTTLDADRLDAHQSACFELAWASAELLAAETAARGFAADGPVLDQRLAMLAAVEGAVAVAGRLESLLLDLEIDSDDARELYALHRLASAPAWLAARRACGGEAALAAAGQALVDAHGEIADLPVPAPIGMAREAFRRFAAEVVAPEAERIHRHDLTVPESLLEPLREMGVFGLSIPERFGGIGPDERDDTLMMVVVTEALSEASLAAAGSLITRPEILSRALLAGGTPAQQAHWLPQIAAGRPLCAIAITEPDHGSDVAGLTLRATRVDGGFVLDGAKTWCTFAGKAGLLMVVARTEPDRALGHRGLSLLLVEKPSYEGHAFDFVQPGGGRLRGTAIPTIGYRGMHSFELAFERVFVPDAAVVGEAGGLGKGFYFTMAGMMGGRMQTAARASGVMHAAIRAAFAYAGDRRVFGKPLLAYPLTLAKLARMAARFTSCRRLAYEMAEVLDAGGGRMEASLVKLIACRSAEAVTREALQIHGGMGYAEETAVSRYFVDARVLSIFEGAEETLALKVVARSLLEAAVAAPQAADE